MADILPELPRHRLLSLRKYDRIAIYLFRRLVSRYQQDGKLPAVMDFELDDVRAAMRAAVADDVIDKEIDNVPDIKYTYDARLELPAEIERFGPWTWLQNGKGRYKLRKTRRPNIIDLTALGEGLEIEVEVDQTPPFISSLLGEDEQAVFTRVRNVDLLSKVLGFKVWPIQGHHRTTVSYGQIEIDEVQAGLDRGKPTVVPISGKGGQDKLSWSQALNLNTYAKEKSVLPEVAIRSIGLWRDDENTVWVVEFSPDTNIDRIEIVKVRRFKFR